jgi:hypothetical protein
VHWAPGIPCALCYQRRDRFLQNLGRSAPRDRGVTSEECERHSQPSSSGLTGRSSIPETSVIEPRGRGVLDTPHARGMTVVSEVGHRILTSLRGATASTVAQRAKAEATKQSRLVIRGRCEASDPESRDSPMRNCASEVWSFGPSRNDGFWIASRSLSSGTHSRDPLARNDGEATQARHRSADRRVADAGR